MTKTETQTPECREYEHWFYTARDPDKGMPYGTHLIYRVCENDANKFEIAENIMRTAFIAGMNVRAYHPAAMSGDRALYDWKCNCCRTNFKHEQKDRTDDGMGNGGAKCPVCKADGQYTYRENPVENLKAVLCAPEGKCCIDGSDEDRAIDAIIERMKNER